MVEAETIGSIYGLISTWFTPSCLFIFINLVIGTIFVIGRFSNPVKPRRVDSPELTPSPSLIHRFVSFNLPSSNNHSTPHEEKENLNPARETDPVEPTHKKLNRVMSIEGEVVDGGEELEGVDEKADNFIKRFKEQLRLQRLESILRYRDMIKGN